MFKLNHIVSESLNRYFDVLTNTGYLNYEDVYKLLFIVLLDDILNGELGIIISEEDYKYISNILYCLFGSNCLIPYPVFKNNTIISTEWMTTIPMLSEDTNLRFTELDVNRLVLV